MRLAADIILELGGETITLRPSLRAAVRLYSRWGDFATLAQAIADQSITAMADVLADHVAEPCNGLHGRVLFARDEIPGPLLQYLARLLAADSKPAKDGGPGTPFPEYFERLFKIGTGWLGWTPEQTWSAAPAEIVAAYEGRLEMLAAIFGGSKSDAPKSGHGLDWSDKFKMLAAGRKKRAA